VEDEDGALRGGTAGLLWRRVASGTVWGKRWQGIGVYLQALKNHRVSLSPAGD
jgi:hypothetical protein